MKCEQKTPQRLRYMAASHLLTERDVLDARIAAGASEPCPPVAAGLPSQSGAAESPCTVAMSALSAPVVLVDDRRGERDECLT